MMRAGHAVRLGLSGCIELRSKSSICGTRRQGRQQHTVHRHRKLNASVALAEVDPPVIELSNLDDWRTELGSSAGTRGTVVALGKFDAMHKGHRALAAKAAETGAQPWLLSFSGMAEVLNWPARPPLVAVCDRARVLASWAAHCGGRAPCQRLIPFAAVRTMSPEEFVRALALDLKARKLAICLTVEPPVHPFPGHACNPSHSVSGVVVGEGFRFGYKAAGDTAALLSLGQQHGLEVSVVDLVAASGEDKVSSSAVRSALEAGQVELVSQLLRRRHRLIVQLPADFCKSSTMDGSFTVPRSGCLNQPPGVGSYPADVTIAARGGKTEARRMDVAVWRDNIDLPGLAGHAALDGASQLCIDF